MDSMYNKWTERIIVGLNVLWMDCMYMKWTECVINLLNV